MTTQIYPRNCARVSIFALSLFLCAQVASAKNIVCPAVIGADCPKFKTVSCEKGESIQAEVDKVAPGEPTAIFIEGMCEEDVTIRTDDIFLSGNNEGVSCDKNDPGGTGTIAGTVTIESVRARIEHLTITGTGHGVNIQNRAVAYLTCNDISGNEGMGVQVLRSSNAVLRDNTLSGNGTRGATPSVFFDCGLFAGDASSVDSRGNTYADNRYCGIEIDRQSAFRQGAFQPNETGHPANPAERDVITQAGCDPSTGIGCFGTTGGPSVAIEIFNGGVVDVRNIDVNGQIDLPGLSSLRVDGDAVIQGHITANFGSIVRLRSRVFVPQDRMVTFEGTLFCANGSQTFFSDVQCGQTCNGGDVANPASCAP